MTVFLVLHDHDFKSFLALPTREVRTGQVQGEKCVEVENTILLWKESICELSVPHSAPLKCVRLGYLYLTDTMEIAERRCDRHAERLK